MGTALLPPGRKEEGGAVSLLLHLSQSVSFSCPVLDPRGLLLGQYFLPLGAVIFQRGQQWEAMVEDLGRGTGSDLIGYGVRYSPDLQIHPFESVCDVSSISAFGLLKVHIFISFLRFQGITELFKD